MNLNQKIYITAGIILILIILAMGFLIKPLIAEIKATSDSVSKENGKLDALKDIDKDYLTALESDYRNVKDNLLVFKINLSEKQIIDFIVELEGVANNSLNNLEIKSADFPDFTLSLTGSLPNLMKFLGWLENNPYLVNIESINIRRLSEKDLVFKETALFSPGDVKTILEIKLPINKP